MIALKYFNFLLYIAVILCRNIHGMSISQIDDIIVSNDGKQWKCDRINCPMNTMYCVVLKYTTNKIPNIMHRKNFCYAEDNSILLQKETEEEVDSHITKTIKITTTRNGSVSSSSIGNSSGYQSSIMSQDFISNGNVGNFHMPNIVTPNIPPIKMPEIKIRKVRMPSIMFPEITIPEIYIPQIEVPQISIFNN